MISGLLQQGHVVVWEGERRESVLLVAQKPLICLVAQSLRRGLNELMASCMPCQSILSNVSLEMKPFFQGEYVDYVF